MRLIVVLGLAAIGLGLSVVVSSGPPAVDRDAWGADLAELGVRVDDWPTLVESTRALCTADGGDLDMLVAVADKDSVVEELRVGFDNVCPHRLDDFDTAVHDVTGRRP